MKTCTAHPDRETGLSCGTCGTPLCAECAQHSAVGLRCATCLHGGEPLRDEDLEQVLPAYEQLRRSQKVFLFSTFLTLALSALSYLVFLPVAFTFTLAASWRAKAPSAPRYAAGLVYYAGLALLVVPQILLAIGNNKHAQKLSDLHVTHGAALIAACGAAGLIPFLLAPAWRCARELLAAGRSIIAGGVLGASLGACVIASSVALTLISLAR